MNKKEKEKLRSAMSAITEEDLEWFSDTDAARYRKDVERVSKPSLLARLKGISKKPEVSHENSED
jgi:hypothetical protein